MMNVLWYVSDLCACGIVRADVPARQLNQTGRIRAVVKRDSVLSDLFGTDLIVIQRGCVEQHRHWMKLAQARGIPVVYDLDDDLFSVPEHVKDAHDYFSRPQAKAIIAEMLQQADLVTVSTPTMAEVAQKYTRRPIVIVGNCVDLGHAEATMNRTKPARLTIGWHGSAVHLGDTAIVKDALVQVLQKHDEVDLSLWGHFEGKHFDGAFDVFGPRVQYHNWAQPMDLYAILSTFDIGLAPLDDTPFNVCKSAVKWMEYAAAEVPCICSPLAPYQGVVADGDTGLLPTTNDTAGWLECLEALVTSRHLRSSVARGAKLEVLRKYDNTIVSKHWEATFQKVLAGARHAAA